MRAKLTTERQLPKNQTKTEIHIDLIDGAEEASLIASTDLRDFDRFGETFLYVDVGGGSTEFTVFAEGRRCFHRLN